MSKTKVFGYVRVSGKGQVDGDGFTRQEEAIQAFARGRGYLVERVFREEGVSGTASEEDRPAFKEMVAAILRNGVRTIIIEGMDRLARELRIQEHLVIYLASKGTTLLSARTEEDVTEAIMGDPMKKALVQMQGVFSELERGLLVKKLRTARERIREKEGKCEGRKSTQEVSPELVDTILSLRQTASYAIVAQELNALGLSTVSGKAWTASNVQNICSRFSHRKGPRKRPGTKSVSG